MPSFNTRKRCVHTWASHVLNAFPTALPTPLLVFTALARATARSRALAFRRHLVRATSCLRLMKRRTVALWLRRLRRSREKERDIWRSTFVAASHLLIARVLALSSTVDCVARACCRALSLIKLSVEATCCSRCLPRAASDCHRRNPLEHCRWLQLLSTKLTSRTPEEMYSSRDFLAATSNCHVRNIFAVCRWLQFLSTALTSFPPRAAAANRLDVSCARFLSASAASKRCCFQVLKAAPWLFLTAPPASLAKKRRRRWSVALESTPHFRQAHRNRLCVAAATAHSKRLRPRCCFASFASKAATRRASTNTSFSAWPLTVKAEESFAHNAHFRTAAPKQEDTPAAFLLSAAPTIFSRVERSLICLAVAAASSRAAATPARCQ
mmetsp:Transcript_54060/g.93058  ORF Transcript_54060/g.93058 Transcript_54060/m.93058 type:complete len:382 (+) Transcript_54060:468-1613(+)